MLFQHGDLVVFSRGQRPPPNFASAHQLFSHGAVWQDAELLPTLGADEGLLVQHQGERIFLPPHHHIGQTSVGALACTWDYPSGAMTTAAFPTPNLEFRGNFCSHLLRVVGIPAVNPDTPANVRRRDFFVLCDFRALGYSPRIVHSNVATLHMPSVADAFGVCIPIGQRLATWEGNNRGEEVLFEGQAILTFFTEEDTPPLPRWGALHRSARCR